MKLGMRMPARINELYASEVKFGHAKKPHRFLYLIDGEKYLLQDVLARSQPLNLKDATVIHRLLAHSSHTWDELLRPANPGKCRNAAEDAVRQAKRKKTQARAAAYQQAAKDKRDYFAAKRKGHKEL